MSTQVNFAVHIFDMDLEMVPELEDELREALSKAIQVVLSTRDTTGYSLTVRGPEIVSLFN
jgi:heme oxygenase